VVPNYLARMISHKAKWLESQAADDAVDAAVRDLKTDDSTISFWRCDPGQLATLENVVIALASNRETIARLDIVILNTDDLIQARLDIVDKPGDTPAATLNVEHRDVAGFTLTSLVAVARLVHNTLKSDASSRRFPPMEVRALLQQAIANGILQADRLHPKLAADLARSVPPTSS
jgi:hypothetical protein